MICFFCLEVPAEGHLRHVWQAEQRPSESCPIRMPKPRGCVALHGKRHVADVITLRVLGSGDCLDYPGGTNVITKVLRREGTGQKHQNRCDWL